MIRWGFSYFIIGRIPFFTRGIVLLTAVCRRLVSQLTMPASPNRVLWLRNAVFEVCPPPPTAVRTKLQWAKCLIDSDSAQWGLHGAPAMLPAVTLQASFACHPLSQRRSPRTASEQTLLVFINVTNPPSLLFWCDGGDRHKWETWRRACNIIFI